MNPDPDPDPELENWTMTWIDRKDDSDKPWSIDFMFGSEEYELVDLVPETDKLEKPILLVDEIIGSDESVVGTIFEVIIPNFFDPLPLKRLEIDFIGLNLEPNDLELPHVLDIIGSDSPFFGGGPSVPVLGQFISAESEIIEGDEEDDLFLWRELWKMNPNPDFETVKVFVPIGFELDSLHITTQSLDVPEPATLALVFSGLLGLGVAGRRRAA